MNTILKFQNILSDHPYYTPVITLYQNSFPACERQPESRVYERTLQGIYQITGALIDGKLAGMAICRDLKASSFILLDYLAIDHNQQGQSIGSQLFSHLVKNLPDNKHLLMEVEDPRLGENQNERIKRVQFYIKNGAFILEDVNYLLPSLDGSSPTPMWLMIAPGTKESTLPRQIVRQLINQLYNENYLLEDEYLLNIVTKDMPETIKLSNAFQSY